MDGNEEFRMDEGEHGFQVFLGSVAGNVDACVVAGDDVCAETHEVVDGAAYAVFVARDRGCRDDDGVAGMNLYLTVAAVCHAGEACHRFALASCGEDADAVVSVAVKFFRFNECAFRRFEVAHFTGDAYDIDHGTAEDADFSLECQSGIDCHLDTGYVGCECGKDNAALGVGVGAHERLGDDGFGRGVARVLCIGGVSAEGKYASVAELSQFVHVGLFSIDR